jgi:hypothetical protein
LIQVELLRAPLSKLLQNHTKDVASAAVKLDSEDIQTLVDFLDLVRFRSSAVGQGVPYLVFLRLSRIISPFLTSATESWHCFQESQHQPVFSPVVVNSKESNITLRPSQGEALGQYIEESLTQIYASR